MKGSMKRVHETGCRADLCERVRVCSARAETDVVGAAREPPTDACRWLILDELGP